MDLGAGEDLAFQVLWFQILSCHSDACFSSFTPPKYVTLPPSVSPLYPYKPPLPSAVGLSDFSMPLSSNMLTQSIYRSAHQENRAPLCKAESARVLPGPLVQRPVKCDQHFHSFIHSQPDIQGSYPALYGEAEMDEHSSCPQRTYNDRVLGGG